MKVYVVFKEYEQEEFGESIFVKVFAKENAAKDFAGQNSKPGVRFYVIEDEIH